MLAGGASNSDPDDGDDRNRAARELHRAGHARILLVDDDISILDGVEELLTDHGYAVERAMDGVAAIERLERGGVDVLLLDIALPRLSGWGVLDWIQTSSTFPISRVLVYTGTGLTQGAFGRFSAVAKWEPTAALLQRIEAILKQEP